MLFQNQGCNGMLLHHVTNHHGNITVVNNAILPGCLQVTIVHIAMFHIGLFVKQYKNNYVMTCIHLRKLQIVGGST